MHPQKNLLKTAEDFVYHVSNDFGIPWHFAFSFLTGDATYSTNIISFTYNTLKREKQKTLFLPLISLFWSLCVSLL